MSLFKSTLNNKLLNSKGVLVILKRFKRSNSKVYNPCEIALKHFDDYYKTVFGRRWPSVRLGLLTKQKYFAVINNFGDIKKTEENFINQGAFNLRTFFEAQKDFVVETSTNKKAKKKNETDLDDIVQQKIHQEEEKEANFLHPEGLKFKTEVDTFNQEKDEREILDNYTYKPEDAMSSLESDLQKSEIDESRLIRPGSISGGGTLHEFMPVTQLRGVDEYISESEYYKYYKVKPTTVISFENENEIEFPEHLLVYTFDRGEVLEFSDPVKCVNDVYNYRKVDGGELLTALALGVKSDDKVLDLCSVSGDISYCIFQMLRSKILICTSDKRQEIEKLFKQYLYGDWSSWDSMLYVTPKSANEEEYNSVFDKVLVSVPSTFDKTALSKKENNMFHITNVRRRLKLPELQISLLVKGMKLVRPGGTVVYTTSTLSPVQNEGVVNEAVNFVLKENNIKFTVKKLSPALKHMSFFFEFGDYLNLKFGTLVVPFIPVNFGPRYISKLVRSEEPSEENEEE